jgi:hypothetical protein
VGGRRIAATRNRTLLISAPFDLMKGTDMRDVKDSNGIAREHQTDESEETFDRVLKKIAEAPASKSEKPRKAD